MDLEKPSCVMGSGMIHGRLTEKLEMLNIKMAQFSESMWHQVPSANLDYIHQEKTNFVGALVRAM